MDPQEGLWMTGCVQLGKHVDSSDTHRAYGSCAVSSTKQRAKPSESQCFSEVVAAEYLFLSTWTFT